MCISLIGKKIGMTQMYTSNNTLIPITVVEAGPCPIVQIKTLEKDGYNAVQIAFNTQKESRLGKGLLGHYKKAKIGAHRYLREFRVKNQVDNYLVGDILTVKLFKEGKKVDIISTTKGRGFQGVVKRFNFSGGPASHGSMSHRRGGSYGQCQFPGEIFKGKKMPGHMGMVNRTTQNLTIVKIIKDKNLLLIKGSIHGFAGRLLLVRESIKNNDTKSI